MARARGEGGNIGIWAVLTLSTVGGFMALAVHAGRTYSNRGELQNGADAAALAAAAQLNGTAEGLDRAADAARAFGAEHFTENQRIAIDAAADVTFGTWDRAARTFTPIAGRTEADLNSIIAVRVRDQRRGLPVEFGPAFLRSAPTTDVGSQAVAVGGGPCRDNCAFPAAFADCMLMDQNGALQCNDRFFVLNSDWQDNLGLTSLQSGVQASVPNIKEALRQCVRSGVDDPIPVTNGNPIQPVFNPPLRFPLEILAPVVHAERCDPGRYEKCVAVAGEPTCTNAKFLGNMPIRGYVSIVVCYVTDATVKAWPPADWGPTAGATPEEQALWAECGPPPALADFPGVPESQWPDPFLKQTIFMKHRCHWEDPGNRTQMAGCQSFGIWTSRSRLVQ